MRLALSCLVDADHDDTATYDRGFQLPDPPDPKWADRLESLDSYVEDLAAKSTDHPDRVALRTRFYEQCRSASVDSQITSCTGPVGIGKTTAVLGYLLKTAQQANLDRIFIVAPFTNIIDQTVAKVREAIVFPGEDPEAVVELSPAKLFKIADDWETPK